jgi:hypothetical protein
MDYVSEVIPINLNRCRFSKRDVEFATEMLESFEQMFEHCPVLDCDLCVQLFFTQEACTFSEGIGIMSVPTQRTHKCFQDFFKHYHENDLELYEHYRRILYYISQQKPYSGSIGIYLG